MQERRDIQNDKERRGREREGERERERSNWYRFLIWIEKPTQNSLQF